MLIICTYSGPLIGRWNLFLEQRFPLRFLNGHKTGSVSVKALTKRVASDQIIMYVVLFPTLTRTQDTDCSPGLLLVYVFVLFVHTLSDSFAAPACPACNILRFYGFNGRKR